MIQSIQIGNNVTDIIKLPCVRQVNKDDDNNLVYSIQTNNGIMKAEKGYWLCEIDNNSWQVFTNELYQMIIKNYNTNRIMVETIRKRLAENNLYYDVCTNNNIIEIFIEWGDWKHDHGYLNYLMKQQGYEQIDEKTTEEDGSDCYSSIHFFAKC